MVRAFIALELPREVIDEINKIQKLIWKKTLFTGKLTESENLHLTFKFLGDIDDGKIKEVKKRLSEVKINDFYCEIGEVGVFSKNVIRIIWVKLNGGGIFKLQREIDEKLKGLFPIEERFMSHITIARVKKVGDKKGLIDYLASIKPKKLKFLAKNFVLKKSELLPEGPVYEDIEEYNLEND